MSTDCACFFGCPFVGAVHETDAIEYHIDIYKEYKNNNTRRLLTVFENESVECQFIYGDEICLRDNVI